MLTKLLLVGWGWALVGCCFLHRYVLLMWLLLLGCGWAAHVATAPGTEAGCLRGFCSSDGGELHVQLLLLRPVWDE